MLDELHIRGLGVIEEVTLRPAVGLTVVTGETGAGKTMLVTALQLLLGERADASLVRSGAAEATVDARLMPPPPEAVAEGWCDADADELVVSREVTAGDAGDRSRARIGGRLAPASALEATLGARVEVHAQGEHVRLSRSDVQRALLDRYAGDPHARTLASYRETYEQLATATARLETLTSEARERAREQERLGHEIGEIEAAGLDPERDGDIDAELERLEHAEELALAAAEARQALGEEGAGAPLGLAVAALRRAGGHDAELDDLRDRAETLAVEARDLRTVLRDYAEDVAADPAQLEELRHRRRLIVDLQRKYGDDIEAVLAYARDGRERLAELEQAEEGAAELENRVEELTERLGELATDVRAGRTVAAERLADAVNGHLRDLAMPHATFAVSVAALERPRAHGADQVVFELAANPGEPSRPLAQAASGGERSRVALSVEVALADVDEAEVLVFDEVDAGIGGGTAMIVGEKLARLARDGRQVLCVTHLPQLAAFADVHHVVEKGIRGGRTVTTVREVVDADRAAELARMLSGRPEREVGLAHARELLEDAATRREAG